MSRLHVHIATADLSASIDFYTRLFGAAPDVVRQDYASWRVGDPALNLEISSDGSPPGINHLGIHAQSEDELAQVLGDSPSRASCCGGGSKGYWLTDAQNVRWERVLDPARAGVFRKGGDTRGVEDEACCVPIAPSAHSAPSSCCVPSDAKSAETIADSGCGCG